MLQMELGYFDCVKQALSGKRDVDEQTLTSVAILSDRLESLKVLSSAFAGIELSNDVKQMVRHNSSVAVS